MRFWFAILAALLVSTPVAAEEGPLGELATSLISGHIVPGYDALAKQAQRLDAAIKHACKEDAPLSAPAVQAAFKATSSAWMRVQHIRFGPSMKDDRFYRFQFWPDKHGQAAKQIRRRLAGPIEKIPDTQDIGKVSVALQGLPALERILFTGGKASAEQRDKACKLAHSIGFNLATMAHQASADWQDYSPQDHKAVLESAVRNMMEQLQIIITLKLARPLGSSLDGARPRRAESWRSRMSLRNIRANLEGLSALLGGQGAFHGLASVLVDEGETLGVRAAILEQLAFGIKTIEGSPLSLHDAVTTPEGRKVVMFLVSHLEGLRQLLFEQLAPALGVNLGFNAQDGD